MASTWAQRIQGITWLRWGAATVLILLCYWVFSDLDINFGLISMLMPLTYLFTFDLYASKNGAISPSVTVLLLPILVNIALWRPSYGSYLFLKIVLYAERIRLYCLVLLTPFVLLLAAKSSGGNFFLFFLVVIVPILIRLNTVLTDKFANEMCCANHSCDAKNFLGTKSRIRSAAIILIVTVIAITYLNIGWGLKNYADMRTREFIYSQPLKYSDTTSRDGKGFLYENKYVYVNKPINSVKYDSKFAADGTLIFLRTRSIDAADKEVFIFDTDSMQNIKILPRYSSKESIGSNGFTPTRDGKYVIVGYTVTPSSSVNFKVVNVATGEFDQRFIRPKTAVQSQDTRFVDMIEFNKKGDYFAVIMKSAAEVEIWDYLSGKLIYSEITPKGIKDFVWISDNKFLLSYYKNSQGQIGELYEYEVLKDGSVVKREKKLLRQRCRLVKTAYFL